MTALALAIFPTIKDAGEASGDKPTKLTTIMVNLAAKMLVDYVTRADVFSKSVRGADSGKVSALLTGLVNPLLKKEEELGASFGAIPDLCNSEEHQEMIGVQIVNSIDAIVAAMNSYIAIAPTSTKTEVRDGKKITTTIEEDAPFAKLGYEVISIKFVKLSGTITFNVKMLPLPKAPTKAPAKAPSMAGGGAARPAPFCKDWEKTGECKRGAACFGSAAHVKPDADDGFVELPARASTRKTALCKFFHMPAGCDKDDDSCPYIHEQWVKAQNKIAAKKGKALCWWVVQRDGNKCTKDRCCTFFHPKPASFANRYKKPSEKQLPPPRAGAGAPPARSGGVMSYAKAAAPRRGFASLVDADVDEEADADVDEEAAAELAAKPAAKAAKPAAKPAAAKLAAKPAAKLAKPATAKPAAAAPDGSNDDSDEAPEEDDDSDGSEEAADDEQLGCR